MRQVDGSAELNIDQGYVSETSQLNAASLQQSGNI